MRMTKGCIATPCKDVFFVTHLIEVALNRLIKASAHDEGFELVVERSNREDIPYALCTFELSPESRETVRVNFRYRGEHRAMYLYFGCDAENREIAAQSISLTLACWGQSDVLMEEVLRTLSCLGAVYIDANDADDIPFVQLGGDPMSFLQACAEGLVPSTPAELARWRKAWPGAVAESASVSIERFLGLPAAEVEDLFDARHSRTEMTRTFKGIMARELELQGYTFG